MCACVCMCVVGRQVEGTGGRYAGWRGREGWCGKNSLYETADKRQKWHYSGGLEKFQAADRISGVELKV